MDRKVWLPSGGSLVIDRTEAMTVVDVNTGKFVGSGGNLEETVTKNNLEAAEEIVRQLRLRDIGGIIVIDFIDMVLESNRDLVLRRLLECLGRDRTKHQVAEVTSLGLVQMTRKRVGLRPGRGLLRAVRALQRPRLHRAHEPIESNRVPTPASSRAPAPGSGPSRARAASGTPSAPRASQSAPHSAAPTSAPPEEAPRTPSGPTRAADRRRGAHAGGAEAGRRGPRRDRRRRRPAREALSDDAEGRRRWRPSRGIAGSRPTSSSRRAPSDRRGRATCRAADRGARAVRDESRPACEAGDEPPTTHPARR